MEKAILLLSIAGVLILLIVAVFLFCAIYSCLNIRNILKQLEAEIEYLTLIDETSLKVFNTLNKVITTIDKQNKIKERADNYLLTQPIQIEEQTIEKEDKNDIKLQHKMNLKINKNSRN